MKKNGFTLIELLAVIVILAILALVVTITTGNTINTSKNKLSQIQIQKVEEAAKIYYLNEGINDAFYNLEESKTCVNLSYLTENGYIEEIEIKNPKDDSDISGSVKITYKSKKYKYEYQNNECNHSDYFISLDTVCNLVSDVDNSNSVTVGDKYQCKVKDKMEAGFENGYYFYVLSYNDKDGNITENIESAATLNLIMERNMHYDSDNDTGIVATETNKGEVEWYATDRTNEFGPVTAMDYLYNATKDWVNIPNVMIGYMDEGGLIDYGYGKIITTNNITKISKKDGSAVTVLTDKEGYTNLKARIPKYTEVHGDNKCLTYTENESKYGSCPLWLANYMSNSEYVTGEGLQNISGITGYWTLSSDGTEDRNAWYVDNLGSLSYDRVYNRNGVRPVITLGI